MGQITSSVGLVSGINTSQIISELISLDSQPITLLQNRIASANAQTQAYQLLGTQFQSLQQIGQSLELPTTFDQTSANSSDPSILTATSGTAASAGSYSFDVASLVTSQQAISNGYTSANSLVGAGTITISQGGGEASSQTTLANLNGGTGVDRGQFRITDGSGNSAVIDLSTAVTLDDAVNKINSTLGVSVNASIKDDHLVINDTSGQNKANFSIQDLGNGTTATDLGIVGNTTGTTITGTDINTISNNTPLSLLNDGRGIGTAGGAPDFQVTTSDGTVTTVSLGAAQTVGDLLSAINKAGGTKLSASIDAATNSIKLTDTSHGSGTFSVAALNNSSAANDLGFLNTPSGGTINGNTLLASLDSVLVSSLNGGAGIPLGTIHITDRTPNSTGADIDLSGAKSVQDILDDINNSGLKVSASLNDAGDGIQIQDTSGDNGNIVISDVNSTTAAALGIAGTFDSSQSVINGSDLHTQYVSDSTLLSSYNGGKGVNLGSFTITNSKGAAATVDLSQGTYNTIGDVISAINAKGLGVTADINSTGDGILLTDTNGGSTQLRVTDVSGTTASDLNIAGTATGNAIDGAQTKTIAVTATDTLTTVQQKIQALGYAATANIVNDGSGTNGYHLAITALNSGRGGRITIDGGTTSLTTQNVVNAQDAAVFYGSANSSQSLLITSSSNQLAGIIPGVTVQLQGTGNVTLNVARDPSNVSTQLQNFTDTFNGLIDEITTLTQWNSTTNQAGLLLGDATVQDAQQQLYSVFNAVVNGAGKYKLLSDVGLTLGNGAKINFDATKFASAYASDPTAVQNLFTQATTGLGSVIDKSLTEVVDPVDGSITREEATVATQIQQFQDSITQLNSLLDEKRNTLEQQFANMETVLAGLQSQGATLSSINTTLNSNSSSASKSSSTANTSNIG